MSDSGDAGMGSLLHASQPASPAAEDVDPEAPPPSVSIDIHPKDEADHEELAGKFAALLAAHAAEQKILEDRVAILEALRLTEKMAAAAQSAADAAASAAQSAAEAAKLIETSEGAVQCAAEVLTATREAMRAFGSSGNIQSLLSEHCVNAAVSAKDLVVQCLDDAREDVLEFVEETRKHEQAAAAASTGKRGGGKKR